MPHTSSRRRQHAAQPHPTKLTAQASEDGWSQVVRKGGAASSTASRALLRGAASSNAADLAELLTLSQLEYYHKRKCGGNHGTSEMLPQPQKARCSEEELAQRFRNIRKLWLESGMRRKVNGVLGRAGVIDSHSECGVIKDDAVEGQQEEVDKLGYADAIVDGVEKLNLGVDMQDRHTVIRKQGIDKAICLGLGSPSADTSGWRQTVLWQLAAFLEIVEALRTSNPSLLAYAQDPIFNDLDRTFLSSLHIEVLPTPQAFPLITPTTLVYAPHYPVASWPSSMRLGNVSCIIGNDVNSALSNNRILDAAEISRLFSSLSEEGSAKSDAGRGHEDVFTGEIPDLHAKSELQAFVEGHVSERWPAMHGMAEGAFNDTFAYWRSVEE